MEILREDTDLTAIKVVAGRAQTLAQSMKLCAEQNDWSDADLVAAIPMAVAVITPIHLLDQVNDLMRQMLDGRKVGEGIPRAS